VYCMSEVMTKTGRGCSTMQQQSSNLVQELLDTW